MVIKQGLRILSLGVLAALAVGAHAQLNSRPGAAYTVFLDFNGFDFSGVNGGFWGPAANNLQPGVTAAYSQSALIPTIWARVAEKYVGFDVNVTTVDPAVAAGKAANDTQRQGYYDSTAKVMHTVVGGDGSWTGGGGISYVGVTPGTTTQGRHTNFVFAEQAKTNTQFIGEASAHENGHGFGLYHQGDWNVMGQPNQDYSSNFGASGNGSFAPVMGNSYTAQRGEWRVGNSSTNGSAANVSTQNDVSIIGNDAGNSLVDDKIGHTFATATSVQGNASGILDPMLNKGWIDPASQANPNPIGQGNYTQDFFRFHAVGGTMTLTLHDGGEWLTPGVAADGITLRGVMKIFDGSGNLIGTATESGDTLSASFSDSLNPGDYYAEVLSNGGMTSVIDPTAKYYSMGSYFLDGTGIVSTVPEPVSLGLIGLGVAALVRRRRRA